MYHLLDSNVNLLFANLSRAIGLLVALLGLGEKKIQLNVRTLCLFKKLIFVYME